MRRSLALPLAALLTANVALALGPWLVRLSDAGPVATGFWRLSLAVPLLAAMALREAPPKARLGRNGALLVIAASAAFALDLASWHVGIEMTRLGNAAMFGNAGSFVLMGWGMLAARRLPRGIEMTAIVAAIAGAGLLFGGSLAISRANLVGDLFCLLAGLLYSAYILLLRPLRSQQGSWRLVLAACFVGAPMLLLLAWALAEQIVPTRWPPVVVLALTSQVIGQGFLIYALGYFRPLLIGVALLMQPAIAAFVGWLAFGETLAVGDVAGLALLSVALVLARLSEARDQASLAQNAR